MMRNIAKASLLPQDVKDSNLSHSLVSLSRSLLISESRTVENQNDV